MVHDLCAFFFALHAENNSTGLHAVFPVFSAPPQQRPGRALAACMPLV